jgi:hypothetical protein
MEPSDPKPKPDDPDEAREAESRARDALRGLEERLTSASQAAERLIAEALQSAAAPGATGAATPAGTEAGEGAPADAEARAKPPPGGWEAPRVAEDGASATASQLDLLGQVVQSLRELVPPELQQRLAAALREVLLALRALIDWYLERIEQRRGGAVEVEDIPIS